MSEGHDVSKGGAGRRAFLAALAGGGVGLASTMNTGAVAAPGPADLEQHFGRHYQVDPSVGDGKRDATAHVRDLIKTAAAAGGGVVRFSAGVYRMTDALLLGEGVILEGAGDGTVLLIDHHLSGIKAVFPLNIPSNPQRIGIRNLQILRQDGKRSGVGVEFVSLANASIEGVRVSGFDHGIIYQQVQHGYIDRCIIENQGTTGVWWSNDWVAGGSITPPYNNHLSLSRTLFVGQEGVTRHLFVDDGGWNHVIRECAFENGQVQMRIAGVSLAASGLELESCDGTDIIVISDRTRAGLPVEKGSLQFRGILDAPESWQRPIVVESGRLLLLEGALFLADNKPVVTGTAKLETFLNLGSWNKGARSVMADGRASVGHFDISRGRADFSALDVDKFAMGGQEPRGPLEPGTELLAGLRRLGLWQDTDAATKLDLRGGALVTDGTWGRARLAVDTGGGARAKQGGPAYGLGRGDRSKANAQDYYSGDQHRFFRDGKLQMVLGRGFLRVPWGRRSARPSARTAGAGAVFYDQSLRRPIFSDGSVWRDAMGKRL